MLSRQIGVETIPTHARQDKPPFTFAPVLEKAGTSSGGTSSPALLNCSDGAADAMNRSSDDSVVEKEVNKRAEVASAFARVSSAPRRI